MPVVNLFSLSTSEKGNNCAIALTWSRNESAFADRHKIARRGQRLHPRADMADATVNDNFLRAYARGRVRVSIARSLGARGYYTDTHRREAAAAAAVVVVV